MAEINNRGSKGMLKAVLFLFFLLGCARVSVESKEPIKLDVTMRLDIYQHVTQDVQSIEDMVSSSPVKKEAAVPQSSFLSLGIQEAYAQEESIYPPEVREAIEHRKERRDDLNSWEAKGAIGENAVGLVVAIEQAVGSAAASLVEEENKDRQIIYAYVAQKNEANMVQTGKIFAQRIQADAPVGTPIEVADDRGGLKWVTK